MADSSLLKIYWQFNWQSVNLLAEIPVSPFLPEDILTFSSKSAGRLTDSKYICQQKYTALFLPEDFLTVSQSAGRLIES